MVAIVLAQVLAPRRRIDDLLCSHRAAKSLSVDRLSEQGLERQRHEQTAGFDRRELRQAGWRRQRQALEFVEYRSMRLGTLPSGIDERVGEVVERILLVSSQLHAEALSHAFREVAVQRNVTTFVRQRQHLTTD